MLTIHSGNVCTKSFCTTFNLHNKLKKNIIKILCFDKQWTVGQYLVHYQEDNQTLSVVQLKTCREKKNNFI